MALDVGRQADMARIDRAISDPRTPPAVRKKAEEAKYQIQNQQQYRSVERTREKLADAARSGDPAAMKNLEREADRMHRSFS